MALCPKCGSNVADDAKFCGSCGASITPSASPPSVTAASPSSSATPSNSQSGMSPNVAALLVYLPLCFVGIVCAILFAFVLDPYKKDRFIRFHAWQSLAIHACVIAFCVAWWFVVVILALITHGLAALLLPINGLVGLGALVLMVIMMIKANGGEMYKLPVIGDWAEKQAGT